MLAMTSILAEAARPPNSDTKSDPNSDTESDPYPLPSSTKAPALSPN